MDSVHFSVNLDDISEKHKDWEVLILESLHNCNELDIQYVEAYLDGAKSLQEVIDKKNNPIEYPDDKHEFSKACLPFLFLCQHTIELSIKIFLNSIGAGFPKTHSLINLWSQIPKKNVKGARKRCIDLMKSLDAMDFCGKEVNGYAIRYPFDKGSKENSNGLVIVKTKEIYDDVEYIYNFLINGIG